MNITALMPIKIGQRSPLCHNRERDINLNNRHRIGKGKGSLYKTSTGVEEWKVQWVQYMFKHRVPKFDNNVSQFFTNKNFLIHDKVTSTSDGVTSC